MDQLPDTAGLKCEIVIQKAQRYKYDRVVRLTGARIVEAGSEAGTARAELEAAFGPATAAVLYPAIDNPADLVSLEDTVAIARERGVPVIVDAAYRVYPARGAEAVHRSRGRPRRLRRQVFRSARTRPGCCADARTWSQRRGCTASRASRSTRSPGWAALSRSTARRSSASWRRCGTGWRWTTASASPPPPGGGAICATALQSLEGSRASTGHRGRGNGHPGAEAWMRRRWERPRPTSTRSCADGNPGIWTDPGDGVIRFFMFTVEDGDELVIAGRLWELLG